MSDEPSIQRGGEEPKQLGPSAEVLRARATVLGTIETPLRFFALVILMLEGLLVILVVRAQGATFSWLVAAIMALVFLLVFIVFYVSHRASRLPVSRQADGSSIEERPVTSTPVVPTQRSEALAVDRRLQAALDELHAAQAELSAYTDLRRPILALVSTSGFIDRTTILTQLGADKEPLLRLRVLSVLGDLVEDGTLRLTSAGDFIRQSSGR